MMTFDELALSEKTPQHLREVYGIIARHEKKTDSGVSDGFSNHDSGEVEKIRELQHLQVQGNLALDGVHFQSLDEVTEEAKNEWKKRVLQVKDGFYNPTTGIGTATDPGIANSAYSPVSLSPFEATALYSSGGLTRIIADKKSKILLMNGFEFDGDITPDEAKQLKDYAYKKEFDRAMLAAIRDGIIYGGSVLFPMLKDDTPISGPQNIEDLMKAGILDKGKIDYFVSVDRWNSVVVPNYNITQRDYLLPDFIYIPLGSVKLNTSRASLIKPYPQPYWSAIRQLGWSVSDYEGYIRQILAYEIMIQSLPIMFQQMSLLFQIMPMDATIAMNGADAAESFQKKNEEEMRSWSMMNPKAINSFGDIRTVERNYSGTQTMFEVIRQDIASRCAIPESVLFHTQPTGFSDNSDDLLLKQSEAIKLIEAEVSHNLQNVIRTLAISCFGKDHEIVQKNKSLRIKFSDPVAMSDAQKGENGAKFAQTLASLTQAGLPLDLAMKTVKQFFPSLEIEDEDMERISSSVPQGEGPEFGEPSEIVQILNERQ